MPKEGRLGGKGSFAEALYQELRKARKKAATVYGHIVRGHATEVWAARVFGKAAAGVGSGAHMFDMLYDKSFIESETARIFPQFNNPRKGETGLELSLKREKCRK
jgi:hypothetical protein